MEKTPVCLAWMIWIILPISTSVQPGRAEVERTRPIRERERAVSRRERGAFFLYRAAEKGE